MQANPVPNGRVLKTHNYYSKRPYQTFMYGEFDKLKWSAFIGMGNETQGTALAGTAVCALKIDNYAGRGWKEG